MFQTNIESVMNSNRQERSNVVANTNVQLLDSSALSCAHLEYIAVYDIFYLSIYLLADGIFRTYVC